MHAFMFLNITCSVYITLFVCMFSELTIWYLITNCSDDCRALSIPQLPIVLCLWLRTPVHPMHPLQHMYCFCPCSVHFQTVVLVGLYGYTFCHFQETQSHSMLVRVLYRTRTQRMNICNRKSENPVLVQSMRLDVSNGLEYKPESQRSRC